MTRDLMTVSHSEESADAGEPNSHGSDSPEPEVSYLRTVSSWLADEFSSRRQSFYEKWGKRPIDIIIALPMALISAPIVAASSVLVKIDSRGPIFFQQARVGKNLEVFTVLKLRTMRHGNSHTGQVHSSSSEVTRIGRLLRRLKIDELPQIYNVLRGDMSLVGPRPCLPSTVQDVDENGRYRFLVRPGLSGLAQTNGNASISWSRRWVFDREYVESMSLRQDIAIIFRTIAVIALGERRLAGE